MVTTTRFDGFPAFDRARLSGAADGDTYAIRLSSVENVQMTLRDASYTAGTANTLTYTLSGTTMTIVMKGYTAGTVDVLATGRL